MVKYIYIIMQKVCFWKITRPLFSRKQAGFIAQTALFFHWKTGVFVPNRTKIFAQNGIGACNNLQSRLLRLHTILSHFCGQMVFYFQISQYESVNKNQCVSISEIKVTDVFSRRRKGCRLCFLRIMRRLRQNVSGIIYRQESWHRALQDIWPAHEPFNIPPLFFS